MKIAELRKYGDKVGREGMALEAQKAVNEYDGSYKGVMELCGKLSLLAKAATFDDYWHEQVKRGERNQEFEIEKALRK
ncbi:MAG: hypothetical protein Unbinned6437contig1000_45 [Prokaryotic dsDNA virus sp.]|nr:MAG: hypothetical protein Unbinned6437contig1000_45 [Prokaryotic dsDNA virus sp.]